MAKKKAIPTKRKRTKKARTKEVKGLTAKGKKQGFITQEEILQLYPDAEDRIEELDLLYDRFQAEGIDAHQMVSSAYFDNAP